ncbi:MAG: hypothetical protein K2Y21_06535 [Phycisphaerales bacterium]|nr:hypothetical protein [Phycisphaerales bacterium]
MNPANKERRLPGEAPADPNQSMPAAFAAGLQVAEASGHSFSARRRFNTQHVLIVTTLALSVGMIYGMRRYGMQSGLKFDTTEVSYTRDDATHKRAAEFQKLVAQMNTASQELPPVDKNPFKLMGAEAGDANVATGPVVDEAAEKAKRLAMERSKALETELAELKLFSIMMGKVPIARINDDLVKVGDIAGESFKVVAIEAQTITLMADGKKYTLQLADEPQPKGKTPKAKSDQR